MTCHEDGKRAGGRVHLAWGRSGWWAAWFHSDILARWRSAWRWTAPPSPTSACAASSRNPSRCLRSTPWQCKTWKEQAAFVVLRMRGRGFPHRSVKPTEGERSSEFDWRVCVQWEVVVEFDDAWMVQLLVYSVLSTSMPVEEDSGVSH